ncbi:MAG TPA: hypothetical protein PKE40_16405, partial [Arachnia sp.]|nr:hypothetical protein [Arachnia sp.]
AIYTTHILREYAPIRTQDPGVVSHPARHVLTRHPINQCFPSPSSGTGPIKIVLTDANILYSRVLRDYLVYASDEGALAIRWSRAILDEAVEHVGAQDPPRPQWRSVSCRGWVSRPFRHSKQHRIGEMRYR